MAAAHLFYERARPDPTPPPGLLFRGLLDSLLECHGIGGAMGSVGGTDWEPRRYSIVVDIMSLIGELDRGVDQVNFSPDRLALLMPRLGGPPALGGQLGAADSVRAILSEVGRLASRRSAVRHGDTDRTVGCDLT